MRYLLFVCLLFTANLVGAQANADLTIMDRLSFFLEGEFDNFQQAWQENTKEDLHRVEAADKHLHIHSVISRVAAKGLPEGMFFKLEHREGRGAQKMLNRQLWHFTQDEATGEVRTRIFDLETASDKEWLPKASDQAVQEWRWIFTDSLWSAQDMAGKTVCTIEGNVLQIETASGFWSHKAGAYHLHKCRFFSGWIQYPLPDIPDSTYMMRNLTIHDQGGMVQLVLGDGKAVDCTVELTQLVYGKRIAIMKLALYELPQTELDYNSRSVSYAWASPDSKRLGINIRKIVSGWTLIEPNYLNANNPKLR